MYKTSSFDYGAEVRSTETKLNVLEQNYGGRVKPEHIMQQRILLELTKIRKLLEEDYDRNSVL